MAVPAFMFVSAFQALLPIALGFAAGCMVWMVFAELLPDALQGCSHAKVPPTPLLCVYARCGFCSSQLAERQ